MINLLEEHEDYDREVVGYKKGMLEDETSASYEGERVVCVV